MNVHLELLVVAATAVLLVCAAAQAGEVTVVMNGRPTRGPGEMQPRRGLPRHLCLGDRSS